MNLEEQLLEPTSWPTSNKHIQKPPNWTILKNIFWKLSINHGQLKKGTFEIILLLIKPTQNKNLTIFKISL